MKSTDIKLKKQPDGTFETLNTNLFLQTGDYYFCWKHPDIEYEGYVIASDSFWTVTGVPKIVSQFNEIVFNQRMESFLLEEMALDNYYFALFRDIPD